MLKNTGPFFVLVLLFQSLSGICQSADSTRSFPLKGKWAVISKVEVEKSDGKVISENEEVYKPEEKFFEFAENNTVIVSQDFGKHSEKLPFQLQENNLNIGKIKKNKTPYLVRFQGDVIKLAKTEGRVKKGRKILKTEQVVLRKIIAPME
ncbi:hypothetical protein L0657_21690 [Dyadobacter sp. CY345]|uniref:hypothetical protein n=1 Tax=Dyadobacter sp. CY345 TaxID=2909335 RepID=UPI001F362578|nr:hypothetical protein [Dyadobacter sp. CY345]MCF2446585.1 hypothetical protein [Dyadobacter sp. CY345]